MASESSVVIVTRNVYPQGATKGGWPLKARIFAAKPVARLSDEGERQRVK